MLLLQSECCYCRVHAAYAAYAATAEQMLLLLHAAAAIKPYTVSAANSATSSQEELQPPVDRLLQKPVKTHFTKKENNLYFFQPLRKRCVKPQLHPFSIFFLSGLDLLNKWISK